MSRKPFRVPFFNEDKNPQTHINGSDDEPQAKRRRISALSTKDKSQSEQQLIFKRPGISSLPRKPLLAIGNSAVVVQSNPPKDKTHGSRFNVLWRKHTNKKHKTWDGDGVLYVTDGNAYLQDMSGREMGKTACDSPLLPGSQLFIGGKEVEVDSMIVRGDGKAGGGLPNPSTTKPTSSVEKVPLPKPRARTETTTTPSGQEQAKRVETKTAPRSVATQAPFKGPLLADTVLPKLPRQAPTPRHDTQAEDAIVMRRPDQSQILNGKEIVDVAVDPILTKHLREHQREGVKFMYECVMGMRDFGGQGVILADEMGLGKTLQTIALLWTLLKQNPIHGEPPVIKKALIVCPVTLINNWRKEFRKWLGTDRLGVYVFDDSKKRIADFTHGKAYQIMIIGYEKLRTVADELRKGQRISIVVADEGHRLKTAKNKSAQAIRSLDTARRIILSGTPIQNDLSEFFMMVDFVNPGLLDSWKMFARKFETPILKSRQPGALEKDVEKGEASSEELASMTNQFILRRTADILSKYLPPKTEYVLLCQPTSVQASAYQHVLACPAFQAALGNSEASLQLITVLKKVCNSPSLLNGKPSPDSSATVSPLTTSLLDSIPAHLIRSNSSSTKIRVLDQLLHILRTTTNEKVILVSNYTQTLDLLQTLLTSLAHPFLRLDGSTPSAKRQDLVDEFNRSSATQCFAFLLSAKSGGVGLNLIGASRLVLFDVDWNPATDLQAMARIHRDGQKKPCIIYRFVMAGGLDEKIWQRQVTKLSLASNIMDQKGGTNTFSQDELEDLFRLDEGPLCQTHELLGCRCQGRGLPSSAVDDDFTPVEVFDANDDEDDDNDDFLPMPKFIQANRVDIDEQESSIKERSRVATPQTSAKLESIMAYSHIDTSKFANEDNEEMETLIRDEVLLRVLKDEGNRVNFVFAKTTG